LAWWAVALPCLLVLSLWPVTLAATLRLEAGRLEMHLSAKGPAGRLRFVAEYAAPDREAWYVEARLAHVIRWQRGLSFPGAVGGLPVRLRRLAQALECWEQGGAGDGWAAAQVLGWLDPRRWRAWLSRGGKGPRGWRTAGRLLRRLRVTALAVQVDVGTGEAATTAYAAGAAWAAWGVFAGWAQGTAMFTCKPVASVRPVYHRRVLRVAAKARGVLPQGPALVALALAALGQGRSQDEEKSAAPL